MLARLQRVWHVGRAKTGIHLHSRTTLPYLQSDTSRLILLSQSRTLSTTAEEHSRILDDATEAELASLSYSKKAGHSSPPFRLSAKFVSKFADRQPPFGFNGLGELAYRRTYSRIKPDGQHERWHETVERVVNGTYNMQKKWIEQHDLGWNAWKAQKSAQEMFERIYDMKFLPPGRGLWAMGTAITEEKGLYAALNNCAFVSTAKVKEEVARPFCFLMDAAMLGVGVGFDTKGAGTVTIRAARAERDPVQLHIVDDSREGWVESVRVLITSYFSTKPAWVEFDYSRIRPAGVPIKGFGGVSSGPDCLKELHSSVSDVLSNLAGQPLTVTAIVDLMNQIGRCVVSGNVRQTAEIAFGDPESEEYINLKNYDVNPQRMAYGWTSNNSVFAPLGMDYARVCERIVSNGEPGFAWLPNMQQYSRMADPPDGVDARAMGGNPCLEQTLESYELCCLVETFPNTHTSLEDYKRTLKFAYLYAKTVTLGRTHWPETNRVMLRNRRIGCSMSGIAQAIASKGIHTMKQWCTEGYATIQHYDQEYSDWFAIPRSIKTTTVKPSGTVSLLTGATPGMHYPESRFYIRRMRLSSRSELIEPLKKAGYHIEPAVEDEATSVVSVPVDAGEGIRTTREISMWEQLSLAAFLQKHWADNQVSCTVTFDPEHEGPQLPHALDYFQYQLKGVSFLPRISHGAYPQMPYEEISEDVYHDMVSQLKALDLDSVAGDESVGVPDKFCDNDQCSIGLGGPKA